MAVNKVIYGTTVLVDLTEDTVSADKLAKGETAHDAGGERITGTMEPGIDTSGATATAEDMAEGVTAYVDGSKVTGAVEVTDVYTLVPSLEKTVTQLSDTRIRVDISTLANKRIMLEPCSTIRVGLNSDVIGGDAAAADVAKGKTFTSAAGFHLVGTAESGGVSGGLTVGSADLHNGDEDTADIYLNKGVETAYSGWVTTGYIPIKADTVYAVISTYDAIKGVYCALYDSEKKYVDKISGGFFSANGSPVLFPGSGGYIRFSAAVNTINALSVYECTGSLEFAAGQSTAAALSDDPPAEAELGALTGGEQDA